MTLAIGATMSFCSRGTVCQEKGAILPRQAWRAATALAGAKKCGGLEKWIPRSGPQSVFDQLLHCFARHDYPRDDSREPRESAPESLQSSPALKCANRPLKVARHGNRSQGYRRLQLPIFPSAQTAAKTEPLAQKFKRGRFDLRQTADVSDTQNCERMA